MRPHLLIAEDSPTQREVLRGMLEHAGYDVDAARDGRAAVEMLAEREYAMLISDIVMPEMDGYALCREAKRIHPRLPVILLTSMNDPLDVVHGLQAGADNFMRKPYEQAQLLARVESMLHNRRSRDEGQTQPGLELFFLNQRFMITAERQQMLDLLMSTFEDLVHTNERLREEEAALTSVWEALAAESADAQAQRQRLAAVLRAVPEAVAVFDADGHLAAGSDVYADLVGEPDLSASGASPQLRLFWHDGAELAMRERPAVRAMAEGQAVQVGTAFDVLVERADGRQVPVLATAAPVLDEANRMTGAVEIIQELEPRTVHDLTRLPLHRAFARLVDAAVDASTSRGHVAAVLVAVTDRAPEIRRSLGNSRHDQLSALLAERLREALQVPAVLQLAPDASAGHLGHDELAVVLPGLEAADRAEVVADVIRRHVGGTHRIDDMDVAVTVTVGVTATAAAGVGAEQLVPRAAAAARVGSHCGGDRVERASAVGAADRLHDQAALHRPDDLGEQET